MNDSHPMDTDKPAEIALYMFDITIDGKAYGGEIPAKSFKEAQSKVEPFGGKVSGRILAEMDAQRSICAICGGDIMIDKEHPQPIDDFPDLID